MKGGSKAKRRELDEVKLGKGTGKEIFLSDFLCCLPIISKGN